MKKTQDRRKSRPCACSTRLPTDQELPGIARTASFCGLKGQMEFATCNIIIECFENNDSIYGWNVCMEDQVHASNHGMVGGAFNCNVSVDGEKSRRRCWVVR